MSTTKIQNTLQVNVPDLKSTLPDLKIKRCFPFAVSTECSASVVLVPVSTKREREQLYLFLF